MAARVDDEAIRYQADFWPRDHGKSEIFCIAYPLRRICEDPNVRILVVQKTATESAKTLSVIKSELESNAPLKAYYAPHWQATVGQRDISNATGTVERAGKREGAWQQYRIYVKRTRRGKDPTVEAVGVGGAITGGHFDVIVLDDVEDDENTRTPERIRWLLNWFNGTILQLREPHTKTIVVGTLKTAARDIYQAVLSNPSWNCQVVPAILSHELDDVAYRPVVDAASGTVVDVVVETPDVRTLWPGKWSIRELLLDMLASPVRSVWVREKLNDLRAMAGKIFKREWFRYCSYSELNKRFERIIQIWDTAFEEDESANWSVCITLGLAGGQVYVLDVFRERLSFPRLIPAVETQYQKQHQKQRPERVLIEDKASGKSALQVLQAETTLPVIGVSPGGQDKASRARTVTVYVETGRVIFPEEAAWLAVLEDELVLFPEGTHADQVDALVYGLLELLVGGEEKAATAAGQAVSREQVEAMFG
jgi:predicted phage terminase large subunit-like protein